MTSALAYTTIKDKLEAELGGLYPIIDWEDTEPRLEQSGVAFMALEGTSGTEDALSVGKPADNWLRETGEVAVRVYTPAIEGLEAIRPILTLIRDAMRYQNLPDGAGGIVRTLACSPAYTGAVNEALWSSQEVGVAFRYDTRKDV